jgi:hypothetical protein
MTSRSIRTLAATTLLATVLSAAACGYYLHPERRGNSSNVDGGMLVLDILWLIPGILPGVIALIVDFSTGAVYTNHGGHSALTITFDGRLAIDLSRTPDAIE